jgi:hypothetical protein
MENKVVPLSCHIGTHFTKKVGQKNICMYCNVEVIKAEWITLRYLDYNFTMKKPTAY